jgi:hypothetical protein
VTGIGEVACGFAKGREVVAKAVSSGIGIAPYVDTVPPEALPLVEASPTLLQELVSAEADARIVTIGDSAFCWLRQRHDSATDWRASDPRGEGFTLCADVSGGICIQIASSLGLTFSVQDWLVGAPVGEPVFLEVNPQGQFLFLRDAAETLMEPFAEHLVGR